MVVVVDADVVMAVVAMGMAVQILGESGVPIREILLLPVQIHLRVMSQKAKWKMDDELQVVRMECDS